MRIIRGGDCVSGFSRWRWLSFDDGYLQVLQEQPGEQKSAEQNRFYLFAKHSLFFEIRL